MTHYTSLQQLQSDLFGGKYSCLDLVNAYLEKIEQSDLNAFVEIFHGDARERASVVDQKIKYNTQGRLAGMIIGIKDNICIKDHIVSAGSKMLETFESQFDATVIQRLLKEDAILIGRLNCDEFAMGSANETSYYGPVKNPHDKTKVAGGSSGGSAAAVAAGLVHASLGSDTGGSVRQPASFCGVYGLKPSYGRVSRYGLIAFASSFDQIGLFTRNTEDAALLLEVIAGKDPMDSTCSLSEVPKYSEEFSQGKKLKIAYLRETLENKALNPEVKKAIEERMDYFRSKGHVVEPVDFPYLDYLVPTYYIMATAEASSNLARYDGVHFGYSSPEATDLESTYLKSRSEGFGTEVKRRIMLGTFVLSSGYFEAYYGKAQKTRRLLRDKVNEIFDQYDLILTPTTPHTAFPIGQPVTDPTAMYLEDIFTVLANIVGIPGISVPVAKDKKGLPIGLQLMAKSMDESTLLKATYMLEEGT